ncbi:MAG: exodeoxyribonuclease V subunit alpha [Chlorobium sp.]
MSTEFQERLIDRHFAAFICRQTIEPTGDIFRLVVSMASCAVGKGNICLNLHDIAGKTFALNGKELLLPGFDALQELVKGFSTTGFPGQFSPLVLDASGRLYLYRYWLYEQEVAALILQKASASSGIVDEAKLHEALDLLFPEAQQGEIDLQKKAASIALHRQFCVISGGPGTGKTSTVVRILALLLEQAGEKKLRIAMAAPTGKAAARLKASVSDIRRTIDSTDEIRSAMPEDVVTIQRLLGTFKESTRFRHSAKNPLPFDVVIIDEASMVALPLMHALLTALRPEARLVLLGDRDQLASVEAGAVLGDICRAGEERDDSPLSGSLVMLEKNYRFQPGSGIAELSHSVNGGREMDALEMLKSKKSNGIAWQDLPGREELRNTLAKKVIDGYRSFLETASASEALEHFERFRILSALREGPYGVSGLNTAVESILAEAALITPTSRWYRGRPLLVTENDYALQLFNGDTGILFPNPDNGGMISAFFPAPDGGIRTIPPERLPQHETAFAMTVHKSQGSEFDRVLLILPPVDGDILTRELLYTAITRAKQSVEIWAESGVFSAAVRKKCERYSGLRDALLSVRAVSSL